ncbi:MAG: hypothetical protein U0871_01310 [Gemmataceae bacterium]
MTQDHPPVVYHDYRALVCSFDDSTWVRMGRSVPNLVARHFTSLCRRYLERLDHRRMQWVKRTGGDPARDPFPSYLYNPSCFLTFGHTDSVGLVLIDDIEAMMAVTSHSSSPIEQVQLACCPTLASLGIPAGGVFVDPHTLFDGVPGADKNGDIPGTHSVEREAPLLLWAKLKFNGLVVLGNGLLAQQAAYRTIARRIEAVREILREGSTSEKVPLVTSGDLDPPHLRVAMLAPQGAEDITLLMFARNYSVGIAFLTAVRTLTFADLFGEDPRLSDLLEASRTHQLAVLATGGDSTSVREGLADNHLLSKTYTTLGVSYPAFSNPTANGCGGYVCAYPNLDVNPGHLAAVEAQLFAVDGRDGPAPRALGRAANIHRFLVGRHDYLMELEPGLADAPVRGLPVGGFFRLMQAVYDQAGCPTAGGKLETGLIDVSTSLVIPFPKVVGADGRDRILGAIGPRHRSIMPLLAELRRRCFEQADEQPAPPLCMASLDARMRGLSLPVSLRRATHYLFQIYAHCLSDPFLFDSVLDLHDTFATLHNLLCRILPAAPDGGTDRGPLTSRDLNQLEALLTALHGALTHRIAISLPNWEARDMAIDFRGGLNRLLAAADVPLKCGLGLLRRLTGSGEPPPRNRVGAVTRVTFTPSPGVSSLAAAEPHGIHLAHLDMDVAHILDPFEYSLHAHEVGHLIMRSTPGWDDLLARETAQVCNGAVGAAGAATRIGLDEVAVEMLTYLLVYAPSVDLFRRHLVIRFNSHTASSGRSRQVALAQFGEILLRVFLVTDPFCVAMAAGVDPGGADPLTLVYKDDTDRAWGRFVNMAADSGKYFREYAECDAVPAAAEAVTRYYQQIFRDVYPRYRPSVGRIWKVVVGVYQASCLQAKAYPWVTGRTEDRDRLAAEIDAALEAGRPLHVGILRHAIGVGGTVPATGESLPGGPAPLDEFFVVGQLLRAYFTRSLARLDTALEMHAPRPSPDREIDLDGGTRAVSPALLDPLRSGLVFINPADRRARLRWQAVVHKTLWDQSTHLRSRRLADLFEGGWPGLGKTDMAK